MSFKDLNDKFGKKKEEANGNLQDVAAKYHDIERKEIIEYMGLGEDIEDFSFYITRNRTLFDDPEFGSYEEVKGMCDLLDMMGLKEENMGMFSAIVPESEKGDVGFVFDMMGIFKGLVDTVDTFESHYEKVASSLTEKAKEAGITVDEALKNSEMRDSAIKSVLKTREEYMEYGNADAGTVGEYINITKKMGEDDGESPFVIEMISSVIGTMEKKIIEYHEKRAETLYGGD